MKAPRHGTTTIGDVAFVRASDGTLYFHSSDDGLLAFDADTLRLRWSVATEREGFSSWTVSGDADFVVDDDLVTVEHGVLVRRSARTGAPIARVPFAGQLVDGRAIGARAVLVRSAMLGADRVPDISLVEIAPGPTFGDVVWSVSRDDDMPAAAVRRYDPHDTYSPGDVIQHGDFGPGTVTRALERGLIAAFSMGGRRLACANLAADARCAPPVRGRPAGPRRCYGAAIAREHELLVVIETRRSTIVTRIEVP